MRSLALLYYVQLCPSYKRKKTLFYLLLESGHEQNRVQADNLEREVSRME